MSNSPRAAALMTVLSVWALSGCLGPVSPRGKARPISPPDVVEKPAPPPVLPPVERVDRVRVAALWAPSSRADLTQGARFLSAHPDRRVTVVFPGPVEGEARALFQVLVASGQVDVVLHLAHRPVLPLLIDTNHARDSRTPVRSLPARFHWPADATEHIQSGWADHRRLWRRPPEGVRLPWEAALGPDIALLGKSRLEWGLLPSSGPTPSVTEQFKIPLLRPALWPARREDRSAWIKSCVESAMDSSRVCGPVEIDRLEDMSAMETLAGGEGRVDWVLIRDLAGTGSWEGIERTPLDRPDFSVWIGAPDQNRAWDLLGTVRSALADFQNSGRADVRRLDMAQRELLHAQNGWFFKSFGTSDDAHTQDELKREFVATLEQACRLMGVSPPAALAAGFAPGVAPSGPGDGEAFFERGDDHWRWTDPPGDDRGPGDYFYPTGSRFVEGSWDLRAFTVRLRDEAIEFQFDFTALPNPWDAPSGFSFPLVDLYIDINRLAGAGSQRLLDLRPGRAAATDGWEFALTVDGWGARLHQYVSGRPPRPVGGYSAVRTGPAGFAVSVPRSVLRGDPSAMGFAVLVMGRSRQGSVPMAVAVDPGPDHFGGAAPGRPAPPFIDILTPPGHSQQTALEVYKTGQDIIIPFVRAE